MEIINKSDVPAKAIRGRGMGELLLSAISLEWDKAIKLEFPDIKQARNKLTSILGSLRKQRRVTRFNFRLRTRTVETDGRFYLYIWKGAE